MVSLVVPASSERMLEKARSIAVEEVVIDLEDAVVPERKPEALANVLEALRTPFAASRVAVRVNPVGSLWIERELDSLRLASHLHSVVLPKVESAADLTFVEDLRVQVLIETAKGLRALHELQGEEIESIILGYADLSASLGRSRGGRADPDLWLAIQDMVLIAARALGVRAIDGPYLRLEDEAGLVAAAIRAADMGFDGKWAIHPGQLEPIRQAFAPTPDELEHARAVLRALEGSPEGAVKLDGEMIDEPARLQALRTLERAG